ncbi:hypothetical protein MFIFM68171_04999 [Madurella fahalii]|uniref:DUF7730 domain-containing protein n=1 Tax=Madurella fahalii TaxID=1157608 RepID=A0ABQ0GAT9_9PEZI
MDADAMRTLGRPHYHGFASQACRTAARAPAAEQQESPIFGLLPPELRTLIYTELFGDRRVHLDFLPHRVRNDKVGSRRRWRHGICEDPTSVPFDHAACKLHLCLAPSRRRVLDVAWLFTCRRAHMDGIPVLYRSNVFIIINRGNKRLPVDDLRSFQVRTPNHWHLIRSLEIHWDVRAQDRNNTSVVPHIDGRVGYEALWDALAEMPALSQLRIAVLMPGGAWLPMNLTSGELRELYLGPIMRLKNPKSCQVILSDSYRGPLGMPEGDSVIEWDKAGEYRVSWADRSLVDLPYAPAAAIPPYIETMPPGL